MKGARIALAGAGIQMRRHLIPALAEVGATIAAVIDPDLDRARALAASLGAPAAGRLDGLADGSQVDAVIAACPPGGHEQVIRDAVTARLPILVEKPPAASGRALRELARLAQAAGVPVCVGMNYRHAPGFRALRSYVAGEQRHVDYAHVMHLVSGGTIAAWGLEPVRCFMLAQAIHPVDQALTLLGPPDAVDVATTCHPGGRIHATWTLRRHDRVAVVHVGNAAPGFRNTVTASASDGTVAELRNLDDLSVTEAAGRREFRELSWRRTPFADVIDRLGFTASVAGFLTTHAGLRGREDAVDPVRLEDLVSSYDLLEAAIAASSVPTAEV